MPAPRLEDGAAVRLSGTAHARGMAQAGCGEKDRIAVRVAISMRVEEARGQGLLDADGETYLAAQRRFAEQHDPHSMAELAGLSEGFGIPESTLFAHLHLSLLRDRKQAPLTDRDGCSAWAVGDGPDGPLLVKNRDFSGTHLGIQRVFRHEGPDIASGAMLCVGSLGAPGAYSSGINAAGLALADTAVATSDHGVGWLRYFLMTRLLAECTDVASALAFIAARTHAGGGTLVLADRSGAVAAVELGHGAVAVERGAMAWRTNHFISSALGRKTLGAGGDRIAGNSHQRLAFLAAELPIGDWSVTQAASLMAMHGDAHGEGGLCQHAGENDAATISSSLFACRAGTLYFANGNPCAGKWARYRLDP